MAKLVWVMVLAAPLLMLLGGCAPSAELGEEQQATLQQNLETPVDVDRIRAEYYREKGQEGKGPAPADPGGM